ncbi:MAG: hypothetical protein QOF95_2748 [Pseudonocardiales bacterium]|nr:hypothetical protein [Pseudonocardiales bacterium]
MTSRARLAATRDGWHRVAEHVLAAGEYADTGEISLRPAPSGFQTTHQLADGRQLSVVGTELVVTASGSTRSTALTTVRAAAAFAGVAPGMPSSVYPAATTLDLDVPLQIDEESAQVLASWYELGDAALRRFAAAVDPAVAAADPILWPEHFDVAITVDDVDYGASPGDDAIAEPYVYVSAAADRRTADPFWNARFGGYRTIRDVDSIDDAIAFFRTGRDLLTG